jgi:uncharacterized protein YdeI (YjbR/CyaY-like superfamily)
LMKFIFSDDLSIIFISISTLINKNAGLYRFTPKTTHVSTIRIFNLKSSQVQST